MCKTHKIRYALVNIVADHFGLRRHSELACRYLDVGFGDPNRERPSKDYIGPHPLGQLTFGADGRFSNILVCSDLKKFQSDNRDNGTAAENAEAVKGSIAYFGTYTLTDDRLTMHLKGSTFPNWTGTDQVRSVHLSGNQLTWENAGPSAGGPPLKQVYTRVK